MSGGHYEYKYMRVDELADDIEREFINGGDYLEEDYSVKYDPYSDNPNKRPEIKKNYLDNAGATIEQKKIILNEIDDLVKSLKNCAKRAKELEWMMSGDTGADSYLKRLKEIE
jgi:hypothetical protein